MDNKSIVFLFYYIYSLLFIPSNIYQGSADAFNGIADCVRKTIRNEGFPTLYKGILPPICAETPKRAIKFFCFGSYNAYLSRNTGLSVSIK